MIMASSTEDDGEERINFSKIPVTALNVSTRLVLSRNLNPEQELTGANVLPRDYRGMAQLMDFDYVDLRNFERHADPVKQILEAWEKYQNSTVNELIRILEQIGRHDVIDDALPLIQSDASRYLMKQRQRRNEPPLQVQEVTESTTSQVFPVDNPNQLTLDDVYGAPTYYDAYVCYADEDVEFVLKLAEYLENLPDLPIKLCIRGRDVPLGAPLYDTFVKLMERRCNRMMIVLSPEFLSCHDCEFQARFATGLAVEQRKRMLIPIVYKPCETPPLLKFMSKVDFTKPDIQEWVWRKLVLSIKSQSEMFMPPQPSQRSLPFPIPVIPPSSSPGGFVSSSTASGYTPSHQPLQSTTLLPLPPSTMTCSSQNSGTNSSVVLQTTHSPSSPSSSKIKKWFKEKLGTGSSFSSGSSSSSSGVYSQSSIQSSAGHLSSVSPSQPSPSVLLEPSNQTCSQNTANHMDSVTEADSQSNNVQEDSTADMEH